MLLLSFLAATISDLDCQDWLLKRAAANTIFLMIEYGFCYFWITAFDFDCCCRCFTASPWRSAFAAGCWERQWCSWRSSLPGSLLRCWLWFRRCGSLVAHRLAFALCWIGSEHVHLVQWWTAALGSEHIEPAGFVIGYWHSADAERGCDLACSTWTPQSVVDDQVLRPSSPLWSLTWVWLCLVFDSSCSRQCDLAGCISARPAASGSLSCSAAAGVQAGQMSGWAPNVRLLCCAAPAVSLVSCSTSRCALASAWSLCFSESASYRTYSHLHLASDWDFHFHSGHSTLAWCDYFLPWGFCSTCSSSDSTNGLPSKCWQASGCSASADFWSGLPFCWSYQFTKYS